MMEKSQKSSFSEVIMDTIPFFKDEVERLEKNRMVTIALDFDGTCVHHMYPYIGEDNEHCVDVLKRWIKDYRVGLILDTMRGGKLLEDAIKWFNEREIPLYAIGVHPEQHTWTDTGSKCYAIFSIDDRNVGSPLIFDSGKRPRIDWLRIDEMMTPILEVLARK